MRKDVGANVSNDPTPEVSADVCQAGGAAAAGLHPARAARMWKDVDGQCHSRYVNWQKHKQQKCVLSNSFTFLLSKLVLSTFCGLLVGALKFLSPYISA